MGYYPSFSLTKSTTDTHKLIFKITESTPPWVEGYVNAVLARQFSGQEITHPIMDAAVKFVDSLLENAVNQGLIYRVGNSSEFKSADE